MRRSLTEREQRILQESSTGGGSKARIAGILGCSERTVKHLCEGLFRLYGVNKLENAVCAAIDSADIIGPKSPPVPSQLPSDKEMSVVLLLPTGMTNKEIAAKLKISEVAVKHRILGARRIYGARDRVHLTAIAYLYGSTR